MTTHAYTANFTTSVDATGDHPNPPHPSEAVLSVEVTRAAQIRRLLRFWAKIGLKAPAGGALRGFSPSSAGDYSEAPGDARKSGTLFSAILGTRRRRPGAS